MYYNFKSYREAKKFIEDHKDEHAKLVAWQYEFVVFIPLIVESNRK